MAVTRLVATTDADALAGVLSRNRQAWAGLEPKRPDAYFTAKGQRAIIQDARKSSGSGVVTYNGKMVENLHVESAERTLAIHEAIQALA